MNSQLGSEAFSSSSITFRANTLTAGSPMATATASLLYYFPSPAPLGPTGAARGPPVSVPTSHAALSLGCQPKKRMVSITRKVRTAAAAAPSLEEIQECSLPTWADFDIGRASVFWKTMNGLPPTSGEKLTLFYNPTASKLVPNDKFGIAFNGGFNQPIMCGGEPRAMTIKNRGKADPPIYTIKICVPRHAINLIFSFTNGIDWDGPYRLQFQVLKMWQNRPINFFNEGLAEELSKEGACDRAIFPDSNIVITSCAMIGSLSAEGGDRCNLDLVPGCTDPSSSLFNPLANVDDGSCPLDSDSEE